MANLLLSPTVKKNVKIGHTYGVSHAIWDARVRKKWTNSILAVTSTNLDNFSQFLARIIVTIRVTARCTNKNYSKIQIMILLLYYFT